MTLLRHRARAARRARIVERHAWVREKDPRATASKEALMRRRKLIRSERGELVPLGLPRKSTPDSTYGFDPEEYPALAKAADDWAGVTDSRLKRWRLRLRSMKN